MYIVTGATGFIGSNLIAEMERRGFEDIVAVDSFGNEAKWRNVAKRGPLMFVAPDELHDFCTAHCEEIKAIFHLGAISSTTETDVDLIVNNNFRLTVLLFDFCRTHGIPLIYASSAATYGNGEKGFVDRSDAGYVNALRPLNPYGWSKNAVDKYLVSQGAYNAENIGQVVGLKFFNVYGPNEYHKGMQMSVVRHFFKQYRESGKVRLFKSYRDDCPHGEQRRDFVWVGDCVAVMLWMFEHPHVRGLFNVGTGNATSYNTVARSIAEAMGIEPVIEYIDMPDSVRNQYQYFTEADLSKLRLAGYDAAFTTVPEGVRCYVQDFLMQEDCYL